MMKLCKVIIHKYKCFETQQEFEVDDMVTVLVGLNESGKTSILEAIAKTNYFEDDNLFKFNSTRDYPRKEKKAMDKSGEDPDVVTCHYIISNKLINDINDHFGIDLFKNNILLVTYKYSGKRIFGNTEVSKKLFLDNIHKDIDGIIKDVNNQQGIRDIIASQEDDGIKAALKEAEPFFENKLNWPNPIQEYIVRKWLSPNIPKYLYYDEYYALPSRISIEKLKNNQLEANNLKTAKAFFELADIDAEELINADDFEDFKAELEATQAIISSELFNFWSTNQNLSIRFDVESIEQTVNHHPHQSRIIEHFLNIRVWNNRTKMSLPLENRSKGFNWFFSFLVWFKKIQEDKKSNYILLLDEPGLNLHASAQRDLLNFIESLADNYQVLYTTHSPFMVPSDKLHRVRTVLDTETGSKISDSLQEKDPNTLFPLQAALGYDIAQNLYISKKNLLVEGISDLMYLESMSSILGQLGREGLANDITIVPVGGLEKVATFVSLLRGNQLDIVCLLDSSIGQSDKVKLEKLTADKIIKEKNILRYKNFIGTITEADVEDMFTIPDYLRIFNGAFNVEYPIIDEEKILTLQDTGNRIVHKINIILNIKRYNHYRPANYMIKSGISESDFDPITLDRFEKAFKAINESMST